MIIEVDKKYFIAIMATILVLAGAFFVVSYGGTNPAFMGHSSGEIGLQGFCVFSYNIKVCPEGWSRNTVFENRTIRSTNIELLTGGSYSSASQKLAADGGIGGANVHTHGHVNMGGDDCCGGSRINYILGESSWPPYANVLVCCKN